MQKKRKFSQDWCWIIYSSDSTRKFWCEMQSFYKFPKCHYESSSWSSNLTEWGLKWKWQQLWADNSLPDRGGREKQTVTQTLTEAFLKSNHVKKPLDFTWVNGHLSCSHVAWTTTTTQRTCWSQAWQLIVLLGTEAVSMFKSQETTQLIYMWCNEEFTREVWTI